MDTQQIKMDMWPALGQDMYHMYHGHGAKKWTCSMNVDMDMLYEHAARMWTWRWTLILTLTSTIIVRELGRNNAKVRNCNNS
jgi:hypothetical protein